MFAAELLVGWGLAVGVLQPWLSEADVEYPLQISSNAPAIAAGVFRPQLSDDGRYVLLTTDSNELDSTDANGQRDIYRLDRRRGSYLRVSDSAGVQGNRGAARAAFSADGATVAFHSSADNLLPDDDNNATDVFVWQADRGPNQALELVSRSEAGGPANGSSLNASLSGDGRWIAFSSRASNLVAEDNNEASDIFVRDRQTDETSRVSVSSTGEEGDRGSFQPTISDNGRFVAFTSESTNFSDNEFDELPDLFLHDRSTGETSLINVSTAGVRSNADSAAAVVSPDGSVVAFYSRATTLEPGQENIFFDVFVRDLLRLETELVSAPAEGGADANSFNPSLSSRGQHVAFQSEARNLTDQDGNTLSDIYVVDRFAGLSFIASRRASGTSANAGSFGANISADGTLLVFESAATDLDTLSSGATAGFVAAGASGGVSRLALVPPALEPLNAPLLDAQLSSDGRYALLITSATNLLPADLNGVSDALVLDQETGRVRLLSRSIDGQFIDGGAATTAGAVSDDGCRSAIASAIDGAEFGISPLISDANGVTDIFLRDDCAVSPPRLASVSVAGTAAGSLPAREPALSANGEWIAFSSAAPELQQQAGAQGVSQVYFGDFAGQEELRQLSSTASAGGQFASGQPQLAGDGSSVVFVSADPALDPTLGPAERPVAGQDQIYRYDVASATVSLLSRAANGGPPDGPSFNPQLSADGNTILFVSQATNLTSVTGGAGTALFVWRAAGSGNDNIVQVPNTLSATGLTRDPLLSADGKLVVFASADDTLAGDDSNGVSDVFAVDLDDGSLLTVSRGEDGNLRSEGGLRPLGLTQKGAQYDVAYLTIIDGVEQMVTQPVIRSLPELTVDAFARSPLQSVERGAFRLQVRNLGPVAVTAAQGLRVTLPRLDHPLVDITATPRWQCESGPPVSCLFVGDALVGESIPPGAAEMLAFEFDMFSGDQTLVSVASASLTLVPEAGRPEAELTTLRVNSGVFWEPQASQTLSLGETGVSRVSVINGGQVPVSDVEIDIAPLRFGDPYHLFNPAPGTPWECQAPDDPELPPLTLRCRYTGPALQPTEEVLLDSLLRLPSGVGQLTTLIGLVSSAEVVSPAPLQLMVTEAEGLLFRGSFEG
ncbi:MAG: hypothetical protein AAF358_12460 [Pseudomonadota bacterium]